MQGEEDQGLLLNEKEPACKDVEANTGRRKLKGRAAGESACVLLTIRDGVFAVILSQSLIGAMP